MNPYTNKHTNTAETDNDYKKYINNSVTNSLKIANDINTNAEKTIDKLDQQGSRLLDTVVSLEDIDSDVEQSDKLLTRLWKKILMDKIIKYSICILLFIAIWIVIFVKFIPKGN